MKGEKKTRKLSWTLKSILVTTGVILAAFFLLAESITFYLDARAEIQKRIDELDDRSVAQLVNKINLAVDEMIRFSANLSDHEVLKSLLVQLQGASGDVLEQRRLKQELQNFLVSSATFYNHIARIDVYTVDQAVTSSPYFSLYATEVTGSEVYRHAQNSGKKVNMLTPQEYDLGKYSSDAIFTSMIDYEMNRTSALLVVHMDQGWFKHLTGTELEAGIWSEAGAWIWSDLLDGELDGASGNAQEFDFRDQDEVAINGRQYKIHFRPLDRFDAYVVMYTDLGKVYAPLQIMRKNVVLTIVISFISSLLLSNYISRKVALPVHRLAQVGSVETGQLAKRRSFREILLFYYMIVVTLPLLIYGFLYYMTVSSIYVETTESAYQTNVAQTAEHIDYFLDMNQRVAMNIAAYYVVQNMLSDPQFKLEEHLEELQRLLDQNTAYLGLPGEVFVYTNEGYSVASNVHNERKIDSEYLARMNAERSQKKLWLSAGQDRHEKHSVEFYFKVSSLRNLEHIGYIGIAYGEKSLRSLYREIVSQYSYIELIDGESKVFSSNMDHLIGMQASTAPEWLEESESIYFEQSLLVPEWKLTAIFSIQHMMSDSKRLITLIVIFLLSSFICIVFLSYKISSLIYRSIFKMEQSLMQWTAFHERPDFSSDVYINEIELLGVRFNRMADKIEMLTRNMYESKLNEAELVREQQELEMQALQAQINPHFLYNTLESVKWMIMGDEKEESVQVIENLGDLFRLGTSDSNELVSIEEEIRYTKLYISIQQIRFDEELQVIWDIDQQLLNYPTVKLILQPIVENAIHHGMQYGQPIHIRISVFCEKDIVYFNISDDGRGIPPHQLADIRSSLQEREPIVGEHIGLRNVLRRIQLQYGKMYGIELTSVAGVGTTVLLSVPGTRTLSDE